MLIGFSSIYLILYRPHGLSGHSGENSCVVEVVVRGLEGLQEFEFTIYLSFYILKGLFRDVFTQILFVRLFTGLIKVTLRAELTKKRSVRVKMAGWRCEI